MSERVELDSGTRGERRGASAYRSEGSSASKVYEAFFNLKFFHFNGRSTIHDRDFTHWKTVNPFG